MGVTTERALETHLNSGWGEVLGAVRVVLLDGTAGPHGTACDGMGRSLWGSGQLREEEEILQDNWREELGQERAMTFRVEVKDRPLFTRNLYQWFTNLP